MRSPIRFDRYGAYLFGWRFVKPTWTELFDGHAHPRWYETRRLPFGWSVYRLAPATDARTTEENDG